MNPSRCPSPSRGPSRLRSRCLALAEMSLCELAALLTPRLCLDAPYPARFRERLFTPVRIFWLFLAQIFSPGTSCRESVRKALAWLALAEAKEGAGGTPGASPNSSAFCQGRLRLKEVWLMALSQHLIAKLESSASAAGLWLIHPRFLESIARDLVLDRPGRREPRAYKRRRKNYARLVEPRRIYREILHRSRYTRSMRGDE